MSKRDRQQQLEQRIETEETTILFVDDENIVIDVGQAMLKELVYRVLTAKGGKSVWAGHNSKDKAKLESGIEIETEKVAIEDSEDVLKGGTWDSLNGFWDFLEQKGPEMNCAGSIPKQKL